MPRKVNRKPRQIYAIRFEERIVYIGQTSLTLGARLTEHELRARAGSKAIPRLYQHMRAHNFSGYDVFYLTDCSYELAHKAEQYFIAKHDTLRFGLNSPLPRGLGRPKGCENPSGVDHYASVAVRHLKTGTVYASMAAAAAETGASVATVCLHVNGRRLNPDFERF